MIGTGFIRYKKLKGSNTFGQLRVQRHIVLKLTVREKSRFKCIYMTARRKLGMGSGYARDRVRDRATRP